MRFIFKLVFFIAGLIIGTESWNVFAAENPAEVLGTIKYEGESLPPLEMVKTNEDSDFCGAYVGTERLLIQPDRKGIKNVVVALTSTQAHSHPSGKETPTRIDIKSEKCRFVPHVAAVRAGAVLNLINDDPVLHGYHFFVDGKSLFNVGLTPRQRAPGKKPLQNPGLVEAKCDIHDFMKAFIMVMETPYFAVTDENGAFTIRDVPPGKFLLSVMHESFRLKEQEIEVKPGEKKNLSLGVRDK